MADYAFGSNPLYERKAEYVFKSGLTGFRVFCPSRLGKKLAQPRRADLLNWLNNLS